MEKYKKELSRRIGAASLRSSLVVLLVLYLMFLYSGEPLINRYLHVAMLGGVLGIILAQLFFVSQYQKALKNDDALKKLYYEEMDERLALIRSKAGIPVMTIAAGGLYVAGMVAAYFDPLVSYTLVAAALILFVYQIGLRLYYTAKH